jgi:hypothetical protein
VFKHPDNERHFLCAQRTVFRTGARGCHHVGSRRSVVA